MTRRCSVCDHPQREAVDRALASNVDAIRDIAKRFGLAPASVFRHGVRHVPVTLARAVSLEEAVRAERLAGDLLELRARVVAAIDRADGADDIALLRGVAEARKLIETLAKVAGIIETQVTVNLTASPEWSALVTLVLAALDPHPQARAAVVSALERVAP